MNDLTYKELLDALNLATSSKEVRRIHKELKKYGYGLPLFQRYPDLPLYVSMTSLIAVVVIQIIKSL